jgi:DNA uptake protein ComE-like DNA-binding protein
MSPPRARPDAPSTSMPTGAWPPPDEEGLDPAPTPSAPLVARRGRAAPGLAVALVARLGRAAPGLAVALVAVALVHAQGQPQPPAPAPIPCTRAGLVDGRLRCDDELPADPAALCPGPARPRAHEPVSAGDALHTAQLCARSFASRFAPDHGWARMDPDELAALEQPVDLNRAALDELESLPRVGPKLARRIVEGRPYADVDALVRVRGIGPATVERLRKRAVVPHHASIDPRGRVEPGTRDP